MPRSSVAAGLLALACLAVLCDYRADAPVLINETGDRLEADLWRAREGTMVHSPTSPEEFTDQLGFFAAPGGCANLDVLELRRAGEDEVLLSHDLREQPICEFDVWAYRGGDELVLVKDGARDRRRGW
jgi:hypothetical protein